ncbi:hypothetical protein ACFPYJ_05555 [Paenibacillus solisilvae]|uniref:DUF3784 domain-containing protein n=1 Tax=Paenibacillus solisilvae TaxID=2486751 RepID=A0ABW0VUK5_9BACL
MNVPNIMVINLSVYLGIGLFLTYRFITKEMAEIFDEELDQEDDKELVRVRDELYDALHNLDKIVGRRGIYTILYIGGMLFWLPIWFYARLK